MPFTAVEHLCCGVLQRPKRSGVSNTNHLSCLVEAALQLCQVTAEQHVSSTAVLRILTARLRFQPQPLYLACCLLLWLSPGKLHCAGEQDRRGS